MGTEGVADGLVAVLGGQISGLRRLSGGASRETWAFDHAGPEGERRLILRRDPPRAPRSGLDQERDLLAAAAVAGVPVPEVVAAGAAGEALESAFVIMAHVDGETIPRKILRDEAFASARPKMAGQCGRILAAIHTVPVHTLAQPVVPDELTRWRDMHDTLGHAHPAFEIAFRWLEANRPPLGEPVVVHGDFRLGNLMVGPEGVRAVLDWELAHAGDPLEDLGWLCAKAWRFGAPQPVGGFGDYDELIAAYEAAGGVTVDRAALRWWEVLANLKWGIMCILQALAHTSGATRSVELAAIGRRVCEVEWDLLELVT